MSGEVGQFILKRVCILVFDKVFDARHEQDITSLQELSFGVLPYTSRNVLIKRFFNFQTEE